MKLFQELQSNINNSIYQIFMWNINNLHTAVWFQIMIIVKRLLNNSV